MKPVYQTIFGERGNCQAASIATALGVPLSEVPGCYGADGARSEDLRDWLARRNLALHAVPARGGSFFVPGTCLLVARSPRHDGNHCVVIRDGEIVHDPHPERHPGVGEWLTYILFIVLDPSGEVNSLR